MNKIRTVIVDDEVCTRRLLSKMLREHGRLELVGESSDLLGGRQMIQDLKPELVFTDIDLGDGTGFDLVKGISCEVSVIFLTAHPDFAVRAFELNALDYLLKPIEKHRLDQAITRFDKDRKTIQTGGEDTSPAASEKQDSFLLATSHGTRFVEAQEISMVLSQGNFTLVYISGSLPIPVYRTIKEWRELLPAYSFVQASRSMIVNIDSIEGVVKRPPHSAHVTLKGLSSPLVIGRSALRRLRPIFKRLRK